MSRNLWYLYMLGPYDQSAWTQLNLSSCQSLRTLLIQFHPSNPKRAPPLFWEIIFNVLSTAPILLSSLSLIGSHFATSYDVLLSNIDWERLKDHLKRLPSLELIVFDLMKWPGSHLPASKAAFVRHKLSWWDEKGVLKIPCASIVGATSETSSLSPPIYTHSRLLLLPPFQPRKFWRGWLDNARSLWRTRKS